MTVESQTKETVQLLANEVKLKKYLTHEKNTLNCL